MTSISFRVVSVVLSFNKFSALARILKKTVSGKHMEVWVPFDRIGAEGVYRYHRTRYTLFQSDYLLKKSQQTPPGALAETT
jgi:hypothetical protein